GSGDQPVAQANFAWLNTNVIQRQCLECHGAANPAKSKTTGKEIRLDSYDAVMMYVVKGNAKTSSLYQLVESGKMPMKHPRLPQSYIDAFGAWIDAGAKPN